MPGQRTPRLIGVVNITEDSFSDGGLFLDPGKAVEQALDLSEAGAVAVDLGPSSSHPDARTVPPDEEIRRLEPVVESLRARGIALSVDSWHPETQAWALGRGVDYLNDIRGFPDASLHPELARSGRRLIVMHSIQRGQATRAHTDAAAVLSRVEAFFADRLAALGSAGVPRERILLDPGMGFFLGADAEPSLHVLRNLRPLRERFGGPLLVSLSRKSFLGELTGRPPRERAAATLAAELFAAEQGVDYIRTHDVAALRDALTVDRALRG